MENQKKRILVVDDEPSITRTLKRNLELTGRYEVCTVNNPTLTLSTARQFHPDLILLDVMMPQIDGGTVAAQVQADAELGHPAIVFLTAAATKAEVLSHGGEIGGQRFLAKPVDLAEVVHCIDQHLCLPGGAT